MKGEIRMYTEEYESKGFPFRDFLLKLILIIIFVFLLVWLLPKFISPKIVNKTEKISAGESVVDLSPLTSQIFADNLERMKDAAISYYTNERLPKEVGDSDTMTLSDMIGKKLIVALIDKNNKACDVEKSYVKITKMDDEYLLKVNLKDSEKEDYILVHLGCYNYCDSYLCAKKTSDVPIKASKPTTLVPVKGDYVPSGDNPSEPSNNPNTNPSTKPSNSPSTKPSDDPTTKPSDKPKPSDEPTTKPSESPKPSKEPGYVYEYQKRTGAEFTKWTSWSAWNKTSCSTQAFNCYDDDITCLRKVQLYDRVEKIGTYDKKYTQSRQEVVQTGSYQQKACSKYNYVIINNTTYVTTTSTTYTTIDKITKTNVGTNGGWRYNGRTSYTNPPSDTATTHYEFVGADYSYCNETCTSMPTFYYDSYTYVGGLSTVTNTTSTPGQTSTSTSTSSSTDTKVSATCGSYVVKTIPIYATINVTDIATRKEPLYGKVCYMSEKTRKLTSSGKVYTKWSKYNDRSLLDNGWYYTGSKKVK